MSDVDEDSMAVPERRVEEFGVGRPPDAEVLIAETRYAIAARAPNTLRGYRSDWREFTAWCRQHGEEAVPASPSSVSGYVAELAQAGAKMGTISRRLSAIRFAHQTSDRPTQTCNARVVAVWEGIRRTHGALPEQAAPLMPPDLFHVVDACPTTKIRRTPSRSAEPDLAGARDRTFGVVSNDIVWQIDHARPAERPWCRRSLQGERTWTRCSSRARLAAPSR